MLICIVLKIALAGLFSVNQSSNTFVDYLIGKIDIDHKLQRMWHKLTPSCQNLKTLAPNISK